MKKLFAMILAVVLVLSMSTVAFAAPTDGQIEITNATVGKTYSAYKIFDATYHTEGDKQIASYTIKDTYPLFSVMFPTVNGVLTTDNGTFSIAKTSESGVYTVTTDNGVSATAIAEYLKNYEAQMGTPATTAIATTDTVTLNVGATGYYYVSTNNGTTVTLTNVDPSATIIDKNQQPSGVNKYVKNTDDTEWGKSNVVEFGQKYEYKIGITNAPSYSGTEKVTYYELRDTYGVGVEPDLEKIEVKVGDTVLTKGYYVAKDGTAKALTSWESYDADDINEAQFIVKETGDNSFSVFIPCMTGYTVAVDGTLTPGSTGTIYGANISITATYPAILLKETAKVTESVSVENKNTVSGYFNGTSHIGDDSVQTYTYGHSIDKIDGVTKANLAGVKFKLYADADCNTGIKLSAVAGVPGVYARDEKNGEAGLELVTNKDGRILILGLDDRAYYVQETATLDGYNLLSSPVELKANTDKMNDVDIYTKNAEVVEAGTEGAITNTYDVQTHKVENNTGSIFPETGAMGTIIFTAIGSLLAIAAVVFMITRKKMSVYED